MLALVAVAGMNPTGQGPQVIEAPATRWVPKGQDTHDDADELPGTALKVPLGQREHDTKPVISPYVFCGQSKQEAGATALELGLNVPEGQAVQDVAPRSEL